MQGSNMHQVASLNTLKKFIYKKNMIMILYFSVLSILPFDIVNGLYLESLGRVANLLNLRGLGVVLILYFHSETRRLGYLKLLGAHDDNYKNFIYYFNWILKGLILFIFMRFAIKGGAVGSILLIIYYCLSWLRDSFFFKSRFIEMPTHYSTEHVTKSYLIKRNLLVLAVLSVNTFFNLDAPSYFAFIITYSSTMFLSLTLLYLVYMNDIRLEIPDKIEVYFKSNKNSLYVLHIITQIICIITIYNLVISRTFDIPLLIILSMLTAIKEHFLYNYIS